MPSVISKPPAEMARLFRRYPEAIAETQRFAQSLGFSLKELKYNYPDEPTESGLPPQDELERLAWEGARETLSRRRAGKGREHSSGTSSPSSRELNYARYFLTVHDIVKFARSQEDPVPGARFGRQFGDLLLPAASPMSGPTSWTRCSSASSRRSATSRPTSTSISSTSGATRSSPISMRNTASKRTALAASVVTYRGRSALARGRQGDGPVRRRDERAFRLDLGLVDQEARRQGGRCRRPRQDRSG